MNPAFNDAFGNTTTGIAYQSYTPASLPASAQSSGSVIARMAADKPAEKTDPSAVHRRKNKPMFMNAAEATSF
jgi:hypothetical protein